MEFKIIKAAILAVFAFALVHAKNEKLKEVFSWKQVDFAFPNETARKAAIDSGEFIKEHNLPLGLEVYNDKLFITLPRWKGGILATLTYVSLNGMLIFIYYNVDILECLLLFYMLNILFYDTQFKLLQITITKHKEKSIMFIFKDHFMLFLY